MPRLTDYLKREGIVPAAAIDRALASQQSGEALTTVLVRLGAIDEMTLARAIEKHSGSPLIDLEQLALDPKLASVIPRSFAERQRCVPIRVDGASLYIGAVDPQNVVAWDELARQADKAVRTFTVRASQLVAAWTRIYGRAPVDGDPGAAPERAFDIEELKADLDEVEVLDVAEEDESPGYDLIAATADDSPAVRLVNGLIHEAHERNASDIHLEPFSTATRVRYRIDGVLQPRVELPRANHRVLVSRIKIMAQLDISERRLPQDGRVRMRLGDKTLDLRISTLPTQYGEKVVLRLLGGADVHPKVDLLGLRPRDLDRLKWAISASQGMILVTGPTGSGKTTTLHTVLRQLNEPGVNITTAEDPVEYEQPGVVQAQIRPAIGLTFATALRAFLRQDPDIIMVGEIRDLETAEIAIKASLTGHLVLSTLHTNDSIWTVARLIEMGIEPFLVAAALRAVVAQRLVRRLCPHCRRPAATVDPALWKRLAGDRPVPRGTFAAGRCNQCANGYRGRLPVFEVFSLDREETGRLVGAGAKRDQLMAAGRADGMRTLLERAAEHVEEGNTTLEEAWACCGI